LGATPAHLRSNSGEKKSEAENIAILAL
jgi:hypothetical protein